MTYIHWVNLSNGTPRMIRFYDEARMIVRSPLGVTYETSLL